MIAIKEIDAKNVNTYFNLQMTYLVEDEIITDQEEINYFSSEHRDVIYSHMLRKKNKHHLIYFVKDENPQVQ